MKKVLLFALVTVLVVSTAFALDSFLAVSKKEDVRVEPDKICFDNIYTNTEKKDVVLTFDKEIISLKPGSSKTIEYCVDKREPLDKIYIKKDVLLDDKKISTVKINVTSFRYELKEDGFFVR